MEESKHLASLIGVSPKQIYEIFKAGTDWEFIIKMDALLEAASKKVVKTVLAPAYLATTGIDKFVDALPIRGVLRFSSFWMPAAVAQKRWP